MATTYSNKSIVQDGLVFYMDAANPRSYVSGSNTIDSLKGTVTGSLENGITFSSEYQGNLQFDGIDDYIQLSSTFFPQTYTNLTHCSFIRFYNVVNSSQIIDLRDITNDGPSFLMSSPSGDVLFSNLSGNSISGSTVISEDQIYFTSVTYDGSTAKLYLNGEEESSSSFSTTFDTTALPTIGVRSFNLGTATHARIYLYNLFTYNRALTQEEIQQNYNALKDRFI